MLMPSRRLDSPATNGPGRRLIKNEIQVQDALGLHVRILEAAPLGIGVAEFDPEHDFALIYVNPSFERITGYRSNEVLGRNIWFLQGANTSQASLADIRAAMGDGSPLRIVLPNYRKDGSEFVNEMQLAPVRNESGTITNVVAVLNDMTEAFKARETLLCRAH